MAKQVILKDENNVEIYPESSTLVTRSATFTDILTVAASMNKYSGNWAIDATKVVGMPVNTGKGQLEVIPHAETNGTQSNGSGSFLYRGGNRLWHGYVVGGVITWNELNTSSQDGSITVGKGDGSVAKLNFNSDKAYSMLQMTKGSTAYNNVGLAGTDGNMILGGGEGTRALFEDLAKNYGASGNILSGIKSDGERGIIGGDSSVHILSNMAAYQNGNFDDVFMLSFDPNGSISRIGKDGIITLLDSTGMLQGKAHPIAANADLNNIRTSGVYDSGANTNAATLKNGITNPSTAKGKSFTLTVNANVGNANTGATTIQQDLKTYTGWAFTRTLYLAGSSPIITPWVAYAGTMTQTIAGPANSKINLLRSGNTVQARLAGGSGTLVKGGATTTQKLPLDYVPQFTRDSIADMPEATINTVYDTQSVTVLKDGSMKNYGGGDFTGTGVGYWHIIG